MTRALQFQNNSMTTIPFLISRSIQMMVISSVSRHRPQLLEMLAQVSGYNLSESTQATIAGNAGTGEWL